MKPRIIGLLATVPDWWTATGILWTRVPIETEAANERVFLCSLK